MAFQSSQYGDVEHDAETQRLVEDSQLTAPDARKQAGVQINWLQASPVLWVCGWAVFSGIVVMFNKWLFTAGGFPYPLALTCMHMTTCFVVFGSIRRLAPDWIKTTVMPDADVVTPWSVYIKNFLAISFFYAGTLGTGNLAYLFSSVAFVQMMKPMNCIFASLACFALGVEVATRSHVIIVCIVAFGVAIATQHDAHFSMTGCLLQIVSSLSEGCRLGLMQYVTTSGIKLDPVSTVYHFSFASAVLLAGACFALEWPINFHMMPSPWLLVLNCLMAVVLNVLVATVIRKTSAVIFTLSGIVKDIGLIVASSIFFLTPITKVMLVGYAVSVVGLCMFKAYKDNLTVFQERGFLGGFDYVIRPTLPRK